MEFAPLAALTAVCRERGVLTALDNTWGAGLAFNGFDQGGADLVIQALTKYPSGGGDVLMGSVVTRDEALHLRIKRTHMRLGLGVGANDVEAVLRSLASIELRYRAHDAAARALARWLQVRPEIAQVRHPALPGAPGHAHWQALCGPRDLAAGLFSIVFAPHYTHDAIDAWCDRLRLFKIGYSWGGPMSLVVPYDVSALRSPELGTWTEEGALVRLSIGLESLSDLQADLEQAMTGLR
jgi:cystathionine beta-lyase